MIDTLLTTDCMNAASIDIDVLVELRKILLSNSNTHYAAASSEQDSMWQDHYRKWLHHCIKSYRENIRIIVIRDSTQCVIACAIGIIDQRAPAVDTLNGLSGWVQSVVVSPQWQGNGLAIRLMHNLIFWFNEKDVRTIYLQTTALAESLYRHLEFEDSGEKLLIKHLEN